MAEIIHFVNEDLQLTNEEDMKEIKKYLDVLQIRPFAVAHRVAVVGTEQVLFRQVGGLAGRGRVAGQLKEEARRGCSSPLRCAEEADGNVWRRIASMFGGEAALGNLGGGREAAARWTVEPSLAGSGLTAGVAGSFQPFVVIPLGRLGQGDVPYESDPRNPGTLREGFTSIPAFSRFQSSGHRRGIEGRYRVFEIVLASIGLIVGPACDVGDSGAVRLDSPGSGSLPPQTARAIGLCARARA